MKCLNGTPHDHQTVQESRDCWLGKHHHTISPAPVAQGRPATERQLKYIADLGGEITEGLTLAQASALIGSLKDNPPAKKPAPATGSLVYTQQSMIERVASLLEMIPDGYFAVQPDTDTPLAFLRISTGKREGSRWKGWRMIQTIHGPQLDAAVAISPEGRVREYKNITDSVLLIIADHRNAAIRYAKEIGKCCRCNTRLTDQQSRRRGVGPICNTMPGWEWSNEIQEDEDDE